MNSDRFVVAQFCDDIRQEIGNKHSLMGCYAEDLLVPSLPWLLAKLCAQIKVATPIERPFEKLTVRALLNEELIAELEFPAAQLDIAKRDIKSRDLGAERRMAVVALLTFSPLQVQEACKLRIEAETEEGVLRGSSLSIAVGPPPALATGV